MARLWRELVANEYVGGTPLVRAANEISLTSAMLGVRMVGSVGFSLGLVEMFAPVLDAI